VVLAGAVAAWLALRPAHAPRLLVGVDDDTLKWTADPLNARLTELARTEQAARATHVVLAVFGFARDTPKGLPAQAVSVRMRGHRWHLFRMRTPSSSGTKRTRRRTGAARRRNMPLCSRDAMTRCIMTG
jgi:hypothetical protein